MPPVTLSTVVDLAKIKMKWKEQYVSEGLNKKIVPFAAGIYHGLKLVQNISGPRLVDISVGSDTKHAAVYESATGFSLTYFDVAGASVTLDLSDASLDNQETVIALSISYVIGADTTADWIAYPIADWNALTDAQRAERIVLGTVNVPAPATNITTAMITPDRRTVAWEGTAPGAVLWSPVLRNPSFEHGETGSGTLDYAISDWWNRTNVASNGSFRLGTTTVRSGAKSLELNKASPAATNAEIQQYCEIPVVPGQLIKVSAWIRQLIAPINFSDYVLFLTFGDADSVQLPHVTLSMVSLNTVDAAFRNFSKTMEVPAGAYVLKRVAIQADGVECASGGVAAVFDDVQVFVEAGSPTAISASANARLQQQVVYAMIFEEPTGYTVGNRAALLRYDSSTPVGEGSLIGERKDQADDDSQPALSWYGRLINIGARMLFGSAESALPRIHVPYSINDRFTLIMELAPESGSLKRSRIYAGDFDNVTPTEPGIVITVNARFDGTDWVKDVNGALATALYLSPGSAVLRFYQQATGTDTWAPTAWTEQLINLDTSGVLTLFKDSAGIDQSKVVAREFEASHPGASSTRHVFQVDLGYERRASVANFGTSDVAPLGTIDPHGRYWNAIGRVYEEDFDENVSLATKFVKQDFSGVGTAVNSTSNGSYADIQSGAVSGNHTIIRNWGSANWATNGGSQGIGFAARLRAITVTAHDLRVGFWDDSTFNPDNDNALNGFKIVNGVVSVVWTDSGGLHVIPTGVTVTSGETRWYQFSWNPVNGILQWFVGTSSGVYNGYVGNTYGEAAADFMPASDQAFLFAGCKTNTSSVARMFLDYICGWTSFRRAL